MDQISLMILDPGTEHTSLCLLCGQASSLPTTATSEALHTAKMSFSSFFFTLEIRLYIVKHLP